MAGTYTLNLVETGDQYTDVTTLACPGARKIRLLVANNPVYYRTAFNDLGVNPRPGSQPVAGEMYMVPGMYFLEEQTNMIQFRSAVPGTPAIITVQASG
jgi:hypothetical protein